MFVAILRDDIKLHSNTKSHSNAAAQTDTR
jgi:hypothetical protein